MSKRFSVNGKISVPASSSSHGITVEILDARTQEILHSTLVDQAGHFTATLDKLPKRFDERKSLDIELSLADRQYKPVKLRETARRRIRRGSVAEFKLALRSRDLKIHNEEPTTWTRTGDRIIPNLHIAEIEQALGRLAAPGSPRHRTMANSILCPAPYWEELDHLVQLGWDVLEAQPGAADAFRHSLDTVQRTMPSVPVNTRLDMSWKWLASDAGRAELKNLANERRPGIPLRPSLDHIVPMMMAVSEVAGGHQALTARYFDTVLHMLCGPSAISALAGVARDVLGGIRGAIDQLERGISAFEVLCGPDDGPGRVSHLCPPIDDVIDPACLDSIIGAMSSVQMYAIDSVVPSQACPGESVVISGFGFGNTLSEVDFGTWDGGLDAWTSVTANSWSDTEIRVTVPQDAGCGIRLRRPGRTYNVCGRYVDSHHDDRTEHFEGTAAEILNFAVNGVAGSPVCVEPGENLTLSWRTCAADKVDLIVENPGVPAVIGEMLNAGAQGTWSVPVFEGIKMTTVWQASLTVSGACEPATTTRTVPVTVNIRPNLSIEGIEVTQGIQYYRSDQHLSNTAQQKADNSARLVAGKDAWVRVYMRSGQVTHFNEGKIPNITGSLSVNRIAGTTSTPLTGIQLMSTDPVTAEAEFADYFDERGNIDSTLNFLIPANEMFGRLRLSAAVSTTNAELAACGGTDAVYALETDLIVNLEQTLTVVGMPVGYDGSEIEVGDPPTTVSTINEPTLASFESRMDLALAWMPVQQNPIVSTIAPIVIDYTLDGDRLGDGGCSANWYRLLGLDLLPAKIADGSQANSIYYGFIPGDFPATPGGCASFGVAGSKRSRSTLAHEFTHAVGRPHSPCGAVGSADTDFPDYAPHNADTSNGSGARIGEFGLDIRNGDIRPPTEYDYMSYCSPRWLSLYTHEKLVNTAFLQPMILPAGSADGAAMGDENTTDRYEPMIMFTCVMVGDDDIQYTRVARLTTRPLISGGTVSDMQIELLDGDRVLQRTALITNAGVGHDCSCGSSTVDKTTHHPTVAGNTAEGSGAESHPLSVSNQRALVGVALMPNKHKGTSLRLRRANQTLWHRMAPTKPPSIAVQSMQADGDTLKISWHAETYGELKPTVWARWSHDKNNWRLLSMSLTGDMAQLSLGSVPSGRIFIELIVHDGFDSATTKPAAVTIADRAPAYVIMYPNDESVCHAGRKLRLWANPLDHADTEHADIQISWLIDKKKVAEGTNTLIDPPAPGRHQLDLIIKSSRGNSRSSVNFEVVR